MKKPIIILLLTLTTSAIQAKRGLDIQHLKGNVASVTESVFTCPKFVPYACIMRVPPPPAYQPVRTAHTTDEWGNEASCSYYNHDGDLIYTAYHTYNAANNKTATIKKARDGSLQGKILYSYNAGGYLTKIDYHYDNRSADRTVALDKEYFRSNDTYLYDANGDVTEWDTYKENGDLNYKKLPAPNQPIIIPTGGTETNPGNAGKQVTTTQEDKEGNLISMRTRKFDEHGNIVQATNYDKDSSITSVTVYKYAQYDKYGNWHKATYWTLDDTGDLTYPNYYVVYRDLKYRK